MPSAELHQNNFLKPMIIVVTVERTYRTASLYKTNDTRFEFKKTRDRVFCSMGSTQAYAKNNRVFVH